MSSIVYFDSLYRQIALRAGLYLKPLFENNTQVEYRGEVVAVIPLITWRRGLLHSIIPMLHSYAVIHEDGSIDIVYPEEARETLG